MPALEIVILAAGKGTRMRSSMPKVLHTIGHKPMLAHILDSATALSPQAIHVVIGHQAEKVQDCIATETQHCPNWCIQHEQKGTGHALMQALPAIQPKSRVLVLNGDIPLISTLSLKSLIDTNSTLGLMTATLDNPSGLGRIVRNSDNEIQRIVEEKDATEEQRRIREINTNFMIADAQNFSRWLDHLSPDNQQGELYLTDVIAKAVAEGGDIASSNPQQIDEILGVNSKTELAQLERIHQSRQATQLLNDGVRIMDPQRFDMRGESDFGEDCVVDVNVVLEGHNRFGDRCVIRPGCVLKNVAIGDDCIIDSHTVMESAIVGNRCNIGPFARIRPDTTLSDGVRIGNFVEIKKSRLAEDSKVNHLSYVGDSNVGKRVNIGAGVITCNYDGANKHQTIIGDDVFVGSDSQLVAPVTIADGATIGAGSTITSDVNETSLAISRSRQRQIADWHRPKKKS